MAYADDSGLSIGIYPGTGKADVFMDEFRDAAMPFAQALSASLGLKPRLTLFRTIKTALRSLDRGRLDMYFVPPSLAVSVLDKDYSPVARVKDQATGVLVRRKGVNVTTVAMTEKESWLDVMGRYTVKRNSSGSPKIVNFKTQDDVTIALERNHAQAGSLRSKAADALLAKGDFEIWAPLPNTPDFTLMATNRLTATEQNRLGAAAVALSQDIIQSLQKTIHSKVTGFVIDKEADYKIIKTAIKEAGY
ncbi:MAG: PhnD/SsuA/transferrin family substrate-binding protein [Thiobacillus sp.]|nr:PhnD/SsuA/transferrin family substrate-binding protein [Thiobacillus sp.]